MAILLTGLIASAWIWLAQDRAERAAPAQAPGESDELATLDSRKAVRDIEMNYGQSGVLVERFSEWLASLFHGKRLAWTVALLSGVLAGGCFLAGAYVVPVFETPPGFEPPN